MEPGANLLDHATENVGVGRSLILVITSSACSPTSVLTSMSLDAVEDAIGEPTGELEIADARGLAYRVLGTDAIVRSLAPAASRLPGVHRSPLFPQQDMGSCVEERQGGLHIDYACAGGSGTLRLDASGDFANENGDYAIAMDGLSTEAGIAIDGEAEMRVAGVANPTAPERTSIAPIAYVEGLPDRYEAIEQSAIVVDNERGHEAMACVTMLLGESFAYEVGEAAHAGELVYRIRDRRNVWDCRSELDRSRGLAIAASECRTPIGQGDYAVLRF